MYAVGKRVGTMLSIFFWKFVWERGFINNGAAINGMMEVLGEQAALMGLLHSAAVLVYHFRQFPSLLKKRSNKQESKALFQL